MKRLLFPLVVFLLISTVCAVDLNNYTLVWSAEFNEQTLDSTKFKILEGPRFGAVNSKDAVKVEDGKLIISPYTKDGIHYGGTVSSERLFEAGYGYWESKVRFNTKPGAWSDIWLYSQTVASIEDDIDTAGAEIDIFEHRAADGYNNYKSWELVHGIHYNGYGAKHQNYATDSYLEFDPTQFHIIGLKWDKDSYIFYVDGKETWRTKKGLTSKPLFAIISVEIKDHFWAGDISSEGFDGTPMMEVDYLRYYKEDRFKLELPISSFIFLK